jgi:hypothetical protein
MSNKIISNGGFIPSSTDTPIDLRIRVQSIDDIYDIELPYVGMIVYVIDEDKYYKIKTLKAKKVGIVSVENALVDTFEEFFINSSNGSTNELAQMPEIFIANKNIASEMKELKKKMQDKSIISIVIDPQIVVENSDATDFKLNISMEFVNNSITYFDSMKIDKIRSIDSAILKLEENNLYNISTPNFYYKEDPEARTAGYDCWNTDSLLERSLKYIENQTIEYNSFKTSSGDVLSQAQGYELIQNVKNNSTEILMYCIFHMSLTSNNMPSFAKAIEIPYSTKINY